RCLEPFAVAGVQVEPTLDEDDAGVGAEAPFAAEAAVLVATQPGICGHATAGVSELGVDAGRSRALAGVDRACEPGPFALAAEAQRERSGRGPFAAQFGALAAPVGGVSRLRADRRIDLLAPGVGHREAA